MTRILSLATIMLLALSMDAAARCSMPFIRTINNLTVDGSMTVSSGAPCSMRMRSSVGPTYSAEIVQRPSNGAATVEGANRIVYRSRPGYVGSDAFAYARRGESIGGSPVVRTVRIAVSVVR